MQYFCPNCFAKVAADTEICPSCGVTIATWKDGMSYEDRLIHTLKHPIDETRMGAILALGGLADPKAAGPMVDLCFDWPKDVWQAVEVTRSLHKMPIGPQTEAALIRLKEDHPARPVRTIAEHVWEEMFLHGRRHPPTMAGIHRA